MLFYVVTDHEKLIMLTSELIDYFIQYNSLPTTYLVIFSPTYLVAWWAWLRQGRLSNSHCHGQ